MGSINTRHGLSHDGIKTPRLLGKADHSSVSRGGLYVTENSALDSGALGAARTEGGRQVACEGGGDERFSPTVIAALPQQQHHPKHHPKHKHKHKWPIRQAGTLDGLGCSVSDACSDTEVQDVKTALIRRSMSGRPG